MSEELRILLLEDVSADAELIKRELRKAGIPFAAKCTDTSSGFVRALKEFKPHLILADFSLGQFNALEALQILKEHAPDLPFVLVTGSQSEEVAVACIKEGADDYILKSSLKRLPSAMMGALRKREAERDRLRAEAALRRSEEHFRSLIEHSSDIITIVDENGAIQYESPSLEKVLGYKPAAVAGRSMQEFIHENDVQAFLKFLRRRSPVIGNGSIEFRFRHQNGEWRVLEGSGSDMLTQTEVKGIIINCRDITERKQAEERIREQAALLDKAQDAILVEDLEGRITFWNNSARRMYGWHPEEVLGKKIAELHDLPELDTIGEARAQTLKRGEWHGELQQFTKAGDAITVESRWSLVSDADGKPKSMLVINTDITERKRLESQILRVQRMESIGTLAGGIAHDLNNVLTPVLMAIRMLREEYPDSAARQILDTLETSAKRGSGIVQQVLSFARGVEGERSIFQIKHPLSEIIGIARDTFPKSIHIATKIERDLWPIVGDPTQLHQVFMNLCVNARDAMPSGGRLHIEASNVFIDPNYARMQPDAKPGPHAVVTVSDTGVGIPPALLDKIFEPFFTTKEVGKGTGLGLSTVLGIVKSHGGFLTVCSEVGKGTRFKVHLPAADTSECPAAREETAHLPQGKGELILVADDEHAVREIMRVTLEGNGYRVMTANDGTEAVALYAQHKDGIAVVIVDVMMPYMDGPATMRALQRLNPAARFVAVSGLMDTGKVAEVSSRNRISFLAKPFTSEQILTALRHLLDAE